MTPCTAVWFRGRNGEIECHCLGRAEFECAECGQQFCADCMEDEVCKGCKEATK